MDREKLNDEQQLEPETKAFSSFVILATNDAPIFPRTQNCREKGNLLTLAHFLFKVYWLNGIPST